MFRVSKILPASIILIILLSCSNNPQSQKLNVVFILIDDLGWKDLGFMGSSYYETPNIDRLADQGMIFMNGYAAAANCAPSRACLMTGMNTPRHGIYTVSSPERGDARTRKLIPVRNTEILKDEFITLAEMFKASGYATGTFGKWHLGKDARTQGFDTNVAGGLQGSPGKGGYFAPYTLDHIQQGPDGEYLTDRLTDEAIRFIKLNKDRPFFLYMSHYAVHTPLQGKDELVEKYKNKRSGPGQDNPIYAAMVEAMDQNVGRLLDEIESLGLAKNTIIVFTSDNGGIRSVSVQDPLKAGKGSYYEGGIRVPLIIVWPGLTKKGAINLAPVINLDFFPTFGDYLNADSVAQPIDGSSIIPLLKGEDLGERPLFWHFPVYLEAYQPSEDDGRDPLFRTRPGTTMRFGKWKLHEYFEDGGLELYDLEADPGEKTNLSEQNPEKLKELHNMMLQWRKETHAPVPEKANPLYDSLFESETIRKALMDREPEIQNPKFRTRNPEPKH